MSVTIDLAPPPVASRAKTLKAETRETHERLEAALPELAPALAALGLDPGAIRLRGEPPEPETPPSGRYLDSLT